MAEPTVSHDTFAAALSDKMLHCRELGHTWRPWAVSHDTEAHAYVRTVRCNQCRTERHMVIDYSGHVVSSHYTYQKGYVATNVEKGLTRDTFRLEATLRLLNERERRVS